MFNISSASFLVAHRGDHEIYPENSLAAFRRALDSGARWLECDVQFTRDAMPVVFHDDDLKRMCNLDNPIAEILCSELPVLTDGQAISRMAELLELMTEFPQTTLFLEVKTSALQRFTPAEIVSSLEGLIGSNSQIVPISFSAELLDCWWHSSPRRLGWIGDECEAAPKIPLAFLFMSADGFLNHGCPPIADRVGVYTVNNAQRAQQLLLRGADLIETDHFSRMQEALAHAG